MHGNAKHFGVNENGSGCTNNKKCAEYKVCNLDASKRAHTRMHPKNQFQSVVVIWFCGKNAPRARSSRFHERLQVIQNEKRTRLVSATSNFVHTWLASR